MYIQSKQIYVYSIISYWLFNRRLLDPHVMLSGHNGKDNNNNKLNTIYAIDDSSQNHLEDQYIYEPV